MRSFLHSLSNPSGIRQYCTIFTICSTAYSSTTIFSDHDEIETIEIEPAPIKPEIQVEPEIPVVKHISSQSMVELKESNASECHIRSSARTDAPRWSWYYF